MPLYKLVDVYPNYKEVAEGHDIKALSLYTEGGEKIGSIHDVLLDGEGRFRYLVIDTGTSTLGKRVLLPIGLSKIAYSDDRVYTQGLSPERVEQLPEYRESLAVDYNYEERVRDIYHNPAATDSQELASSDAPGLHSPISADQVVAEDQSNAATDPYSDLYQMTDENHQRFKEYEQRLAVMAQFQPDRTPSRR